MFVFTGNTLPSAGTGGTSAGAARREVFCHFSQMLLEPGTGQASPCTLRAEMAR